MDAITSPELEERLGHWFEQPGNSLVFDLEGLDYISSAVTVQKGDTLYLYSDGVTEATDARYDLFEAPRLEKALADLKDKSPREMIDGTMAGIKDFTREAPQADDITMLAIKNFGPGGGRPFSD
ncbi:MAG: SpoIIE family protein phosphatase [Candidatus Aminicenantales bacterium]